MGILSWLAKWNIKGVVRSQVHLYKLACKENPKSSDEEIMPLLFVRRFERKVFSATKNQRGRINRYLGENGSPQNLLDLCLAIGEVEFNLDPLKLDEYFFVHDIMLDELGRLGYDFGIAEN